MHPSKNQLSKLVELSQDIMAIFGADGKISFINDTVTRTLGYEIKDLTNRPFMDIIHRDDVQTATTAFEYLLADPHHTANIEVRLQHKHGHYLWFDVLGKNFLAEPDINGILVSTRNITEKHKTRKREERFLKKLKDSEKKYRDLFNSNMDGIIKTKLDGTIIEANKSFLQMLGYDSLKEIKFRNFQELTPGKWADMETDKIQNEILARGFADEYEKEYIRKDGRLIPVSIKVWLIKKNDLPAGMWGIVRDISERWRTDMLMKQNMDQLKMMNRHKLEEREKERKALARTIHDDIGQALTAMTIDLHDLAEKHAEDKQSAEIIERLIAMQTETINRLHDLSADLRPGILDDLGLVSAIQWYTELFSQRSGIITTLHLDSFDMAHNTQIALFRIVQEALTNVIRHAQATRVGIHLYSENDIIYLTIEDDGKGIPPEKITRKSSYGILGMRERVEMCGGEIHFSSGKGTKICIYVPMITEYETTHSR